jgi:hypothetical protein
MKEIIKIVLTNWTNLVVMYIGMFVTLFICELSPGIATLKEAFYNTFGSLIVYYIFFWIGFFILIVFLDVWLFGFNKQPQYTNYKLAVEWILISLPLIYWVIKYNEWIFLVAILAFLVGQLLRKPHIFKILQS